MTDPWVARESTKSIDSNLATNSNNSESTNPHGFEDNFDITESTTETTEYHQNLPDSKQYLESLENKLRKLKRDPNILQQLSAKREECIRNLLNDNLRIDHDDDLALDAPVALGDSAVHEIYRHIRPVQPLSVGETVNIVKYDQLEEQRVLDETSSEDSETASR